MPLLFAYVTRVNPHISDALVRVSNITHRQTWKECLKFIALLAMNLMEGLPIPGYTLRKPLLEYGAVTELVSGIASVGWFG